MQLVEARLQAHLSGIARAAQVDGVVRLQPRFHELHKAIWSQLRTEVMKAYGGEAA